MKKTLLVVLCIVLAAFVLTLCGCESKGTTLHTVTFSTDSAGGTSYEVLVEDGSKVSEPLTPAGEDRVFVGWYLGESRFDFTTPVTKDISLTARWEDAANVAVVTFDMGDGVNVTENVVKGEKAYALQVASREGYDAAWISGELAYDFNTPVTEDITLTLVWNQKILDIAFYNYDGTLILEDTVAYGEGYDASKVSAADHPYAKWYTFAGWDQDLTCVKEELTVTAVYNYNAVPDEAFEFVLQEDGTYGLKLVSDSKDYSYLGLSGYYGLPEEYNGIPVTRILRNGIYSYYAETLFSDVELLIPSSYKIIEDDAFYICLKSITVAEGVEEIWACAFQRLQGPNYSYNEAVKISLPSTIELIELCAFYDFHGEIEIASGGKYTYHLIRNEILTDDGHTLVWKDMDGIVNLTVDEEITALYPGVFANCYELQSVVIEGVIEEIPVSTFVGSSSLRSIDFGDGLKKIYGDEQLEEIRKALRNPDAALPLSGGQFNWASQLDVEIPDTVIYIGDFCFAECTVLLSKPLFISANVEYIGTGAFLSQYTPVLPSITVDPGNAKYYSTDDVCLIERGTGDNGGDKLLLYAGASAIEEWSIPEGVTSADAYSIVANNLNVLTVPEGCVSLPVMFVQSGTNFQYDETGNIVDCDGITILNLPSTLKTLEAGFEKYDGKWAGNIMVGLYPCLDLDSIREIRFSNGCNIEVFPQGAIYTGGLMEKFTFPASAKEIGKLAVDGAQYFYVEEGNEKYFAVDGALYEKIGGNRVKMLAYPKNTTKFEVGDLGGYVLREIGENVCGGFSGLTEVIIPEGVVMLHEQAFYNCTGVTTIVLPSTLRSIGAKSFMNAISIKTITFNSVICPELGEQVFMYRNRETREYEIIAGAVIYVPAGSYYDYFEYMQTVGGKLAEALSTEGIADVISYPDKKKQFWI